MRVRVSRWGMLYWEGPHLVWDDYLGQRRLPIAVNAERLLRLFADWRSLEAVNELTTESEALSRWQRVAMQLVDADVLVVEGSPRDVRERHLLDGWGPWMPPARGLHFSTRIGRMARSATQEEQDAAFDAKLAIAAPPPAFKQTPGAPRVPLPAAVLPDVDFATVLNGRRSHRSFGRQPIQLGQVSTLLQTAAGPAPGYHEQLRDRHQTTFKTSPSAGGRHPTELYPVIRNVAGLESGVYHYAAGNHALERLRGPVDDATAVELCGEQPWVAHAGMLLFYASVFRRGQFKYTNPRGYRALFLDVGHLSQTVFLLATALGLRMTFIGVIRDEYVEEVLGLDLAEEFVVGCAVVGTEPA